MLAYLVVHCDAPQSRQHLAFIFWPDSSEAQARTNLRQALHHLRHALPDADRFLAVNGTTIHWRQNAPYTLDVTEFERALAAAGGAERNNHPPSAVAALREAAELYRGELLPGCYDDWACAERERLRAAYLRGLDRLVALLEAQRDYATAARYAQRLLRDGPLEEASYRTLMRLYALGGDRAAALRVFHDCASTLRRELGVEPGRALREDYRRLLTSDVRRATAADKAQDLIAQTPLVGRQREWQALMEAWHLAANGQPFFVSIAGEAGIGKTRLAEELLHWVREQGMVAARTRCYAAEGRLAYGPIIDWLRGESVRPGVDSLDAVRLTEVTRLLPELRTTRPELPEPEPLTQSWQRQRMFEGVARAVMAARQPLLLVIDDLQWCDQETLECLHYLLRFDLSARVLVGATLRVEEVSSDHPAEALLRDLERAEQVTRLTLGPLDPAEASLLARHITGREVDSQNASRLYRHTEGNPLFVVETARSGLLETDPSDSSTSAVLPSKVLAVIAARLHQLSPAARELVSLAATVGREFHLRRAGARE